MSSAIAITTVTGTGIAYLDTRFLLILERRIESGIEYHDIRFPLALERRNETMKR
jgi:hypothetical protein